MGDGVQWEGDDVVLTGFFAGFSVPDIVSEVVVAVVVIPGAVIPVAEADAEEVGTKVRGSSDRTGITRAGETVGESLPWFEGTIESGGDGSSEVSWSESGIGGSHAGKSFASKRLN